MTDDEELTCTALSNSFAALCQGKSLWNRKFELFGVDSLATTRSLAVEEKQEVLSRFYLITPGDVR